VTKRYERNRQELSGLDDVNQFVQLDTAW